jgi:hypothetical protein
MNGINGNLLRKAAGTNKPYELEKVTFLMAPKPVKLARVSTTRIETSSAS